MDLIGKTLANRYEIIEEIGSGGMAVVFKARCKLLNRFVAVKILRPEFEKDNEFVRRFNVEAQAAASLSHTNIVSIFDVGNESGLHYIVMEYIEGESLKEYIDRNHKLEWRIAVEFAIQICKGIEQAHKNNIIHRDIKPHNVLMTADGVLKITDFGIARATAQSTMTAEDKAIGSVHYISPEQARGGYTDFRTDIYSLGIVLYEMLTGVVPFDNESAVSIAIKHLQEKPVPPREYNLAIPMAVENIVLKAIAKEVSARYQTVTELLEELQNILNNPDYEIKSVVEEWTPPANNDKDATIKMEPIKRKYTPSSDTEAPEKEVPVKEEKKQIEEIDDEKDLPETDNKKEIDEVATSVNKKKERNVILAAFSAGIVLIAVMIIFIVNALGLGPFAENNTFKIKAQIPDVIGQLYDDVVDMYKNPNSEGYRFVFEVQNTVEDTTKPEGTILSQTPEDGLRRVEVVENKISVKEEGAPTDKVITIKVTVSKSGAENEKNFVLDDYSNSKLDSVKKILDKENVQYEIEYEFSDEIPEGYVIRQFPKAEKTLRPNDVLTLYVSQGPEESENGETTAEDPTSNSGLKKGHLRVPGPSSKESALVEVKVGGKTVYSSTITNGTYNDITIKSENSGVVADVYYDGEYAMSYDVVLN